MAPHLRGDKLLLNQCWTRSFTWRHMTTYCAYINQHGMQRSRLILFQFQNFVLLFTQNNDSMFCDNGSASYIMKAIAYCFSVHLGNWWHFVITAYILKHISQFLSTFLSLEELINCHFGLAPYTERPCEIIMNKMKYTYICIVFRI